MNLFGPKYILYPDMHALGIATPNLERSGLRVGLRVGRVKSLGV